MSFKSVQAKMAKGGVGMERAGAMLAASTRKNMKKAGMSTKKGIPKNVYQKKPMMKKREMPGMSWHSEVNCAQASRKQAIPVDQVLSMGVKGNPFK